MKAVILAGGRGTRLGEESLRIPKPMVQIGGKPLLWHLMQQLYQQGISEFVLLLGYKGYIIKDYFANFLLHNNDCSIDFSQKEIIYYGVEENPKWKVHLVDTGLDSLTGTRLRLGSSYFSDERFLLTYGDGLSDLSLEELKRFHKSHGKKVSLTAVQPAGRFGSLDLDATGTVRTFSEKQRQERSVNGGFFICEPSALDYIGEANCMWEADPLERLSADGELMAYQHDGFWQCMDTPREKQILEELWKSGNAAWIK